MEIVIKKDMVIRFEQGKNKLMVEPKLLLSPINKLAQGRGEDRGWIIVYAMDEWYAGLYNQIMKFKPRAVKRINGKRWSMESLWRFLNNNNV